MNTCFEALDRGRVLAQPSGVPGLAQAFHFSDHAGASADESAGTFSSFGTLYGAALPSLGRYLLTRKSFTPRPLLLLLPLLLVARLDAEPGRKAAPDDELFRTISSLDRAVFDAFNRCDLEKLGGFFMDDLEFYHDKDGLMRSRQSLLDAVKANICGRRRMADGRSPASSATTTASSGSDARGARHEALRSLEAPSLLQKPREHVLAHCLQTEQHRRPRPVVVRQVERHGIQLEQHLAVGEIDLDGDALPVFLQAREKPLLNVQGRRAVGRAFGHARQLEGESAELRPGGAALVRRRHGTRSARGRSGSAGS